MARGPLAGAAGPGKFAVRTDGMNLPSQYYGEGVETKNLMQGAQMAKTPDVRGVPSSQVRAAAAGGLYDETTRPDEPITAGAPMGAGPGPEALAMNAAAQRDGDIVAKYKPLLETMAAFPDTPESFRIFVRNI